MTRPERELPRNDTRPEYVPPMMTTLREEEVLEEVGPAQAYTGTLPFGF